MMRAILATMALLGSILPLAGAWARLSEIGASCG
jgi:hypothetical protein